MESSMANMNFLQPILHAEVRDSFKNRFLRKDLDKFNTNDSAIVNGLISSEVRSLTLAILPTILRMSQFAQS